MAREVSFMFKSLEEFASLKAAVFGYLQRDVDKLIEKKDLDAEFVNFSQPAKAYNMSWIYIRAFYTWYDDEEDMFGHETYAKVAIPVGQNLFTRDPELMDILDRWAKVYGIRDRFSDVDLVKVRILYLIYRAVKDVEEDNLMIDLTTLGKKWVIMEVADAGNYYYKSSNNAPGI